MRRILAPVALAAAILVAVGCNNSSFYTALGNKVTVDKLLISPATATIPVNGSITFTATGGAPPYTFSMVSGVGSINASTGVYTSPTAGTEKVQVKDKQGGTSAATVTVTSTGGPLAITPSSVSLNAGGSMTFVATGGTPPYTFSLTATGSNPPMPTINATTGAYTAGSTIGSDTVRVTDSLSATSTATVNVTAAVTSVNYAIQSVNLPSSGVGGAAVPGGFSFTIQNIGSANGSQQVLWWVFLSPTATPGSGTVLLQSGSATQLNAGASQSVPLSWTWPSVPPVLPGQTRYLYIMISAADDLTTGNNTYTSSSFTVSPPNIDYVVLSVASTGSTQAGSPISGTFSLHNSGSDNGGQPVTWTAYVSPNSGATIDGSAVVIDSGSTGALSAGGTQAVSFGGTWPSSAATYYLKVAVSSSDQVNTTNDSQVSPAYLTTNVDYIVSGLNNTGGLIAGGPLAGNLTITNTGSANGSQTVTWEIYASTSPSLGAGSTFITSGTTPQLNAGLSSSAIPFSGTWPSAAGSYYIVAKVSATDDPTTGDNTTAIGALTVSPANVNYAVTSVTYTGGTPNPASTVNGNLQFSNIGANNGTQPVTWQVFASLNGTLDASDTLVAWGTYPPLNAGASSSVISFSGVWPLIYGNYFLIATVTAPVDVDTNTTNNVGVTGSAQPVGFFGETEPNSDINLTNANNLGITLQPGMSVSISQGVSMNTADLYDIYAFNTGTATSVTFSLSWAGNRNMTIYVMDSPAHSVMGVGITSATSLSMFWSPVDAAGTTRYIAVENTGIQTIATYTLIISAN